jgi:hypothetical protein
MKWTGILLIVMLGAVIAGIGLALVVRGVALMVMPKGPAHWDESGVPTWTTVQPNTPMRQWQLVCDSNRRILALIQPDDGDSMVLYGSGDGVKWVNHGMYIDLASAQKAGESLKGECPR